MTTKLQLAQKLLRADEDTLRCLLISITMSNIGRTLIESAWEYVDPKDEVKSITQVGSDVRGIILKMWRNKSTLIACIKEYRRLTDSGIKESKLYVEQLRDEVLRDDILVVLRNTTWNGVLECWQPNKVLAIKEYRIRTDCSLLQAVNYVKELMEEENKTWHTC